MLALVALGCTNRQIAGELFISENTAGVHVSYAFPEALASTSARSI